MRTTHWEPKKEAEIAPAPEALNNLGLADGALVLDVEGGASRQAAAPPAA